MSTPLQPPSHNAEVIALNRAPAPPAVVAIISGKGGVGRTHVAVNLACLWQAVGQRVLVLDADIALGGADLLLGVAPINTVADIIDGRTSAADAVVQAQCGVDLLAASAGRSDLSVLGQERRHLLLAAVDELESHYDTLIIDTPAGLSPDALGFCAAATEVVAVVTPEPASVEAVCAWLSALAQQTPVRRVWVLANLVGSAAAGHDLFCRVVRRADHRPGVSSTVAVHYLGAIPVDVAVSRASLRGKPFCVEAPKAPASDALRKAAERLCERAAMAKTHDGSRLFWRRTVAACGAARPDGGLAY